MTKENALSVEIKVIYNEKEHGNRLVFDLNRCSKDIIKKSVSELAFSANRRIDELLK